MTDASASSCRSLELRRRRCERGPLSLRRARASAVPGEDINVAAYWSRRRHPDDGPSGDLRHWNRGEVLRKMAPLPGVARSEELAAAC